MNDEQSKTVQKSAVQLIIENYNRIRAYSNWSRVQLLAGLIAQSGEMGPKVLAAKLLGSWFLLVTSDGNDGGRHDAEGNEEHFKIWLLIHNHLSLNSVPLSYETSIISLSSL